MFSRCSRSLTCRPAQWPCRQIDTIDSPDVVRVLRRAQVALGSPVYESVLAKLDPAMVREDRSALLYPVR